MTVYIKLRCIEVPLKKDGYAVEINEGGTLRQALEILFQSYDLAPLTLDRLLRSTYLVNNVGCPIDTPMNHNDNITVIRTLEGG